MKKEVILQGLNDEQVQAVLHRDGPLLIIAGAGTGKTRTLTHRIAYLVASGVDPRRILAVTFTNKAAKEMRERIMELLDDEEHFPTVRTFHSLGVMILRKYGPEIGLKKSFTIIDRDEQIRMVKNSMVELGIDPKQHDPKIIRGIIGRAQNKLLDPDSFTPSPNPTEQYTQTIWQRYRDEKYSMGVVDFEDLLHFTYRLFTKNSDALEYYQKLWQYVHIDEYQDTNTVQWKISQLLAGPDNNICAVGDSDQNIYSWRGAEMKNILNFEKDYPGTTVVILKKNYRSTSTILGAAQQVIEKNIVRVDKELQPIRDEGEAITIHVALSETDEARFVANECNRLIEEGKSPNDIAVLYRTNFQSRVFEEAFLREGVPYQVLGTKFFDRKEIKDLVSYIRSALHRDNTGDLVRIINTPKRGLGKVSVAQIFSGNEYELSAKAFATWKNVQQILDRIAREAQTKKPSEVVEFALKESGMEGDFLKGSTDDLERLENARELVTYATKYDEYPDSEGIEAMFEDIALMADQDTIDERTGEQSKKPVVRMMTVHAAKGLEYPVVFVVGLEQGLFPSEVGDRKDRDAEEERRLCYVAFTRAKDKLYLSYAQFRMIFGQQSIQTPSEFLLDIDENYLEETDFDGGDNETDEIVYLEF